MPGQIDRIFVQAVKSASRRRNYPFFPWIAIWNVTAHCNLKCWYCNQPPDNKAVEDPDAALASLLRLAPKGIYCFGGEPLMCKTLPGILAEVIKRKPRTYVSLNTNGLLMERLLQCLPYLKQVLYSIDGIDRSNRLNRGCDGGVLFKNLEALIKTIGNTGSPARVVTHTVITRHNYRHLPELVAGVKRLDPAIPMLFFTLIPHSHPLSVRSDEECRREFEETFAGLQRDYRGIMMNTEIRHGVAMDCYRQYFFFFMDPNGNAHVCKPNRHVEIAEARLKRGGLSLRGRLDLYRRLADTLLIRECAPRCEESCDWHLSLEDYFRGAKMMNDGLFPVFQGNLTPEEVQTVYGFISRRISRSFPEEWLTRFLGEGMGG